MARKLLAPVACAAALTACTVPEVTTVANALGVDLSPTQSQQVADYYNRPIDCFTAVERVWPQRLWEWAKSIVWRESRNEPGAANRWSSASGCFQLLAMHADLFTDGWASRFDPVSNALAAWRLYQSNGAAPWAM